MTCNLKQGFGPARNQADRVGPLPGLDRVFVYGTGLHSKADQGSAA